MDTTCRLCTTEDDSVLFHVYGRDFSRNEGFNVSLTKIIAASVGTYISPNDELPQFICHRCYIKVVNFYTFKKMCIENEKNLRQKPQTTLLTEAKIIEWKQSSISSQTKSRSTSMEEEEIDIDVIVAPDYETIDGEIVLASELESDTDKIENRSTTPRACARYSPNTCDVSMESVEQTLPQCTVLLKKMKSSTAAATTTTTTTCDDYPKSSNINSVGNKLKPKTPPDDIGIESQTENKKNKKTKKKVGNTKMCPICDKTMTINEYNMHLATHYLLQNTGRKFYCKDCYQTFPIEYSLERHKKTHHGTKLFKCKTCFRSFHHRSALLKHELQHPDAKPYVCQHCSKAYRQSSSLKNHLKNHKKKRSRMNSESVIPSTSGETKKLKISKSRDNESLKENHNQETPEDLNKEDVGELANVTVIESSETTVEHHSYELEMREIEMCGGIVCRLCHKSYRSEEELQIHMALHVSEKEKMFCRTCIENFDNKTSLDCSREVPEQND